MEQRIEKKNQIQMTEICKINIIYYINNVLIRMVFEKNKCTMAQTQKNKKINNLALKSIMNKYSISASTETIQKQIMLSLVQNIALHALSITFG